MNEPHLTLFTENDHSIDLGNPRLVHFLGGWLCIHFMRPRAGNGQILNGMILTVGNVPSIHKTALPIELPYGGDLNIAVTVDITGGHLDSGPEPCPLRGDGEHISL